MGTGKCPNFRLGRIQQSPQRHLLALQENRLPPASRCLGTGVMVNTLLEAKTVIGGRSHAAVVAKDFTLRAPLPRGGIREREHGGRLAPSGGSSDPLTHRAVSTRAPRGPGDCRS